jgi:AraC-like DNA-binding protein
MVSMDNDLQIINAQGKGCSSKSLLIPAGTQATINTGDSILMFSYLHSMGTDFQLLIKKMQGIDQLDNRDFFYSDIMNCQHIVDSALGILKTRPTAEVGFQKLEEWIGLRDGISAGVYDERIAAALQMIGLTVAENLPISSIAERLNLSSSRLHQLFKDVVGVPMRRYRLWLRIYFVVEKMSAGCSITEAATAAGFADSAQFSRIFRDITGVKPSDVISPKNTLGIHVLKGRGFKAPNSNFK